MANIFRTASIWLKIAIICFGIGLLLFVIGFATTSWMVSHRYHQGYDLKNGLWQYYTCYNGCGTRSYHQDSLNDYHRAIQAMECLGLIGFFLAALTLLLYLCADSCRRRDFLQAATAFTFGGILFACIGFAIFGSNSDTDNHKGYGMEIGWSMGLAIAGTCFYGISGVMLILQLIR